VATANYLQKEILNDDKFPVPGFDVKKEGLPSGNPYVNYFEPETRDSFPLIDDTRECRVDFFWDSLK